MPETSLINYCNELFKCIFGVESESEIGSPLNLAVFGVDP
jgi:hypothetical protein